MAGLDSWIPLPPERKRGDVSVEEAMARRRSVREFAPDPLSLEQVGQLLWAAQGITDPERGFRTVPSAGATFPLEVYVVAGKVEGLAPGVYRYSPGRHALQATMKGDGRVGLSAAALGQEMIRQAPASLVITGVVRRTAERYGERALRYVYMEAGHVGQNVYLQCVSLDLGTVVVGAFEDATVAKVMQLPREEIPLYILPVGHIR